MTSSEAESVKLFSNSYLATRVAFNELDSYCIAKNFDTKSLIDGVSSDPRMVGIIIHHLDMAAIVCLKTQSS